MKYFEEIPGERYRVIATAKDRALKIALDIVLRGADFGQYDIDAFEAGILVAWLWDAAEDAHNSDLVFKCDEALKKLKIHIEAFQLVVDSAGGDKYV